VRGRLRQFAWASVPVWSLSLLAFVPFLRIALARRRARGWAVFAGYMAVVIVEVGLASLPGRNDVGATLAGFMALMLMGVAAAHTFVAFRPGSALAGELESAAPLNELAVHNARARMRRRSQARELAMANHVLARELGIGRPDVSHEYDDGGLVDVNHVPGDVLASCLGLTPQETAAVVAARDQLGGFTSPEELSAYAQLSPDRVDALRDWMLFY
jgi:DNA uptake protein ComE-like DNA-binding protein